MLRQQPSLIDQSSISITILPDTNKRGNKDSSQDQLTALLSRRDTTPLVYRDTKMHHEPALTAPMAETTIPHKPPTLFSSLAEEWSKAGSPIQKFGAMLQRPFMKNKKDFVTTTFQRKGTQGSCINVDYSKCHGESVFSIFLEQSGMNSATSSILYPLLVHQHANLLALFGNDSAVVAAVEPASHPLQTRKTQLAMNMDKEERRNKLTARNRDPWSTFSATTGILHSFGF